MQDKTWKIWSGQCRLLGAAGTWDCLVEGGGRVEDTEGAGEHAAALGQRHQPHEHPIARAALLRLGCARHAQVPAQHLHNMYFRVFSLYSM